MHVWPADAWNLANGEITMRMCEHLNSDEELMPSFYEFDSPDSGGDDHDGVYAPDLEFDTTES